MPTPLEIFLDPLSLVFMAIYAALMSWEALFPARRLDAVDWWRSRGLAAYVLYFLLSTYLPLWWDGKLASFRLFDLQAWPLWAQVLGGFLAFEFCTYWWHRALHNVDFLWRGFHQMHHSAERLDAYGAFWLSPLDMAGFTFIGSLSLVAVAGTGAEAATAVMLITYFLAIFQHLNVATPRWLGYLVQRPESHSHHHGRGIHRRNYSDLPLLDLLFGTFHNPRCWVPTGFYHGASSRVLDMLLWREVHHPAVTPVTSVVKQGGLGKA